MLPGKRYTPEAILRILWRRKWALVVPLLVIATTTAVVASRLPNRYRSETLVLIVPQQIPESYVQPTVSARLEDRLASLNQQILNRTRLEQIIREFNLYAEERKTAIMEDVVDRMRTRDIAVQTTGSSDRRDRSAPTFRISYSGADPRTAMRVTERLASLFIEESLRDRATLAEGTNQFLDTQLVDARNRLVEQEKRLEAYRQKHAGELPSQLNSNMQAMQNIQLQLQALAQSISQDRDRQLMLDRLVAEAEAMEAALPADRAQRPAGRREPVSRAAAGTEACGAARARAAHEARAPRSRASQAYGRGAGAACGRGSAPAAADAGRRSDAAGHGREPAGAATPGSSSRDGRGAATRCPGGLRRRRRSWRDCGTCSAGIRRGSPPCRRARPSWSSSRATTKRFARATRTCWRRARTPGCRPTWSAVRLGSNSAMLEPARLPGASDQPEPAADQPDGRLERTGGGNGAGAAPRVSGPQSSDRDRRAYRSRPPGAGRGPEPRSRRRATPSPRHDAARREPLAVAPCTKRSTVCSERPFDLTPNPRFLLLTHRASPGPDQPRARHLDPQGGRRRSSASRARARRRWRARSMARRGATTTFVYLNQSLTSAADLRRCLVQSFNLGPRAESSNTDLILELTRALLAVSQQGRTGGAGR